MKQSKILAAFLLSGLLVGCSSVYKCGDPIPAKKSVFWGKRLKTVINERDTLCVHLSERDSIIGQLVNDTTQLRAQVLMQDSTIASLSSLNSTMRSNFSELQNEKLTEADQFSRALKQKTQELSEKEKALAEREKSLSELKKIISQKDAATSKLNTSLRNALLGFKADELSVEVKDGKVYVSMSDKLLFASGSATVESKGHQALKALADVMVKNADMDILVEGHTDSIPMKPTKASVIQDNWDLSVMRATSIVRILTAEYGVSPLRITAAGRGEYFPRSSNSTAEGRAKNRRTEIILSPKLDEVMNMLKK